LRRTTHRTIDAVTGDLEDFRFNRAVARIRELTNALEGFAASSAADGAALREGVEAAVQLVAPLTPHLAEELWRCLGHETLLAETPWPAAEPDLLTDETVTIAVQVNGKLRGTLDLPVDTAREAAEAAALALPAVARSLDGKPPRKVVVVPNRIVNVVA
ncbi:MAG: class I tRNA ligase family protein, partial [Alphaproteobacteria bacterium]